jgi:hypothetical protein
MASVIFNAFKQKLMVGEVDFDTDVFNVALLTSSFTPNIDTMMVWGDTGVSSNEITGVAYVTGGTVLAGMTVTLNTSTDKAILDATDVTWASSTITARYVAIYKATAPLWLVAAFDFGADKSSNNGDFTVQWNASGIMDLT